MTNTPAREGMPELPNVLYNAIYVDGQCEDEFNDYVHAYAVAYAAALSQPAQGGGDGMSAEEYFAALPHPQPARGEAVVWMLRDAKTKRLYWNEEACVFCDSSSANDTAADMNDNIDDADFEAFPLYAEAPPAAQPAEAGKVRALVVSKQIITPTCRGNRTNLGAIGEATSRLVKAYTDYVNAPQNENVEWHLTLERVESAALAAHKGEGNG